MKRIRWYGLILLLLVLAVVAWQHRFGQPEDFSDTASEFKYGSIGADHPMAMAPIPYWIFRVLPEVLPPQQVMPAGYAPRNGKTGYDAFGLVTEASMPIADGYVEGQPVFKRPIGASKRTTLGVDLIGFNCAVCHLTTLRTAPGAPQQVVLAGTGNTVDIEKLFLYMFSALGSPDFNADKVMAAVDRKLVEEKAELGLFQRLLYRYIAIPLIPKVLKSRQDAYFDFITVGSPTRLADFGPGRVDTWAVYKRLFADPPQRQKTEGIVDFPPVWNGRARPAGMQMHWDGNTNVFVERNVVSALALIGKNIDYLDFARLSHIADELGGMLPPRFQDQMPTEAGGGRAHLDGALVERGGKLFGAHCAACHAPDGNRMGRVEPIDNLGTDAERHKDFSVELTKGINRLTTDAWQLREFRPQAGYVNNLLDGIWLRGPYLHNGSVPTLHDLLEKPEARPAKFCRGNDVIDWVKVGFVAPTVAYNDPALCGEYFLYDTKIQGNSNAGHRFGTDLPADDKRALLEFLKTQ